MKKSPKRIFDDISSRSADLSPRSSQPHSPANEPVKKFSPSIIIHSDTLKSPDQKHLKSQKLDRKTRLMLSASITAIILFIGIFLLLRPQKRVYRLATWQSTLALEGPIIEQISSTGTLIPYKTFHLTALEEAQIKRLPVVAGETVQAGQLLVELDVPGGDDKVRILQDELKRQTAHFEVVKKAALLKTEQLHIEAQKAYDEAQRLRRELQEIYSVYQVGGISKRQVEAGEEAVKAARLEVLFTRQAVRVSELDGLSAVQTASATINSIRSELKRAEAAATRRRLVAPFAGVIDDIKIDQNQPVTRGTGLLTLLDTRINKVVTSIPSDKANQIAIGAKARLTIGAGMQIPIFGTVQRIGTQAVDNQQNNTVEVEISVSPSDVKERPNTSVNVDIELSKRDHVITLPEGAYLTSSGGEYVYVINSKARAQRRPVQLGSNSSGRREVKRGLRAGERILTTSYDNFREFPEIELAPTGELK